MVGTAPLSVNLRNSSVIKDPVPPVLDTPPLYSFTSWIGGLKIDSRSSWLTARRTLDVEVVCDQELTVQREAPL